MTKYILPAILLLLFSPLNLYPEEKKNEGVWYKVNEENDVNSIYVDYTSIKRKDNIVNFEQMEFLLEKQKLEGTKREYKFITSKRKADCDKKRYRIREQKFYDIEIDKKEEKIKDELVFEDKDESEWVEVIPNTLVEKVWRFVCLYRPEENK